MKFVLTKDQVKAHLQIDVATRRREALHASASTSTAAHFRLACAIAAEQAAEGGREIVTVEVQL